MPVSLYVSGDYACFTRPEFRLERISYDVPTPTAARGILEAIYWKPEMQYVIKQIDVLKPIQWMQFTTNERKAAANSGLNKRTQRSNMVLRDVAYVIHASIQSENPQKHLAVFKRRLAKGQCFRQPCFGVRDFPVTEFRAATADDKPIAETRDLGWMVKSIDWENNQAPRPYHARMNQGVISV